MKGHLFTFYCFLGIIALILIACRSEEPAPEPPLAPTATLSPTASPDRPILPSPPPSPTPTLAPPTGATALLGVVGQPDSLNPFEENDATLRELAPLLFETLLRVDPQTAMLRPGLAESWEYTNTDNEQQVIFHLADNLQWSNGQVLTARTIIDSLRATQHPALLSFSDFQAPADDMLVLTFNEINCSAVTTIAQLPLISTETMTATVPLGSGPFVVAEWSDNGRNLTLFRNPNYHSRPSNLGQLIIRFLRESELDIARSEGQFDLLGPSLALGPITDPRLQTITYPKGQMIYVAINNAPKNDEPLPAEVHQALVQALDRQAILEEAAGGEGQLLAGSLLPDHWAANNELSIPAYNPEIAKDLLRKAGLRDQNDDGWLEHNGQRLELSLRVNGRDTLQQNLAWLVSSYYRDVGIYARAEGVGFDSVVDDLFTHDFTTAIFSWPILPDPDQQLYWQSTENEEGFGLNFTSYKSPRLDRLLKQANRLPGCDPVERAAIYSDIQQILAEDRPVDFLLAPNQHLLVAQRLEGLQPGPFNPFTWNAVEWAIKE